MNQNHQHDENISSEAAPAVSEVVLATAALAANNSEESIATDREAATGPATPREVAGVVSALVFCQTSKRFAPNPNRVQMP